MRITLEHGHPDEREIEADRVSFWVGDVRIDAHTMIQRSQSRKVHEVLEIYSPETFVVRPISGNVVAIKPDKQ